MDNLLDRFKIAKLNQDQINGLNSPITHKEIEAIINNLPNQKSPGPDNFCTEFYQTLKENLIPIHYKIFHKIETGGTIQNLIYDYKVRSIPKSHKDPTKKKFFRPISHMKIDADMVKISIMLKIIYRFNAITIKIPTQFLRESEIGILNSISNKTITQSSLF